MSNECSQNFSAVSNIAVRSFVIPIFSAPKCARLWSILASQYHLYVTLHLLRLMGQ